MAAGPPDLTFKETEDTAATEIRITHAVRCYVTFSPMIQSRSDLYSSCEICAVPPQYPMMRFLTLVALCFRLHEVIVAEQQRSCHKQKNVYFP